MPQVGSVDVVVTRRLADHSRRRASHDLSVPGRSALRGYRPRASQRARLPPTRSESSVSKIGMRRPTTSAHTPGPWQLEYDAGEHIIRMGSAITNRSQHQVQHIITYDHGLFADHDSTDAEVAQFVEADANARLIAAAPEMYEAL